MDHLAIPVGDQARSRRFYETYFGFGAKPARRYDDGVLMLYDAAGFSLALGPADAPIGRPAWMHFGVRLPTARPCSRCATGCPTTASSSLRCTTSPPM